MNIIKGACNLFALNILLHFHNLFIFVAYLI